MKALSSAKHSYRLKRGVFVSSNLKHDVKLTDLNPLKVVAGFKPSVVVKETLNNFVNVTVRTEFKVECSKRVKITH